MNFNADIYYPDANGGHTSTVDLRTLPAWRLEILRDEAAAAGDNRLVATIGTLLAR